VAFSTDTFAKGDQTGIEQALADIESIAHKTVIDSFSDIGLNKFQASTVAASSLAYARMKSSVSPVWPIELECLTALTWKSIEPCLQKLQAAASKNKKVQESASTSAVSHLDKKVSKCEPSVAEQENFLGKRVSLVDYRYRKVLGDFNYSLSQSSQSFFGKPGLSNSNTQHNYFKF
jgi:hypothetical protein